MYRIFLVALAVVVLFSNFSCPSPCEEEFFDSDGAELIVALSDASGTFSVGDEFSLAADFPATMTTPRGNIFTISEQGGLVTAEIYRILPDTNLLAGARADFTTVVTEGELVNAAISDTTRAFVLRYRCPAGNCSLRQTLRPQVPGEYILRVRGGNIDEISADFRYCGAPRLTATSLVGGDNFPPAYAETRFEVPDSESLFGQGGLIASGFNQPVYYFIVE